MPTNIRFRRGLKEELPSVAPSGMPLWCEDTQELYLGTGDGVTQLTGKSMSKGLGKHLFETFYSFSAETPPGAYPLWTGTLIPNCKELLPEFWAKAIELSKEKDIKAQLLVPMFAPSNSQYTVEGLKEATSEQNYLALAEPNSFTLYSNISEFPVGFKINFNELQAEGIYIFSFANAGSKKTQEAAPPTSVEITVTKEDGTEISVWTTSDIPQEIIPSVCTSGKINIDYAFKSVSFKILAASSQATVSNFQISKVIETLTPRIRVVSQEVYDSEVNTYTETGAFVINEADGSLRLPKITRFISSIENASQIGKTYNDQILEHTHTYRTDNQNRPRGDDRTNCFTFDTNLETSGVNGARKGNENLVKHVKIGLYIQVYNTAVDESLFNVAEFNNTLLNHTHPQPPQYFINSGVLAGTTTYVYPPSGYTMNNLTAFIPSIRTIYFSGDVNGDDSLYCYYGIDASRITIICYNSEQRANPSNNWLAAWRK